MRIIKGIFYGICIILMTMCIVILIFALNPSLTRSLADALYGTELPKEEAVLGAGDLLREETEDIPDIPQSDAGTGSENMSYQPDVSGLRPGNTGYVAPVEEQVTLPESVDGRFGYVPVKEESQEVADNEADSLQSTLSTGAVGEELDFDPVYYPYYGMLEPNMQSLYRQIYANAGNLTQSFAPVAPVTAAQLKNVFEAVYNDHPELFWLETGYSCKYTKNGQCVEVSLRYNSTAGNLEESKEKFDARARGILQEAQSLSDNYAKEKYIHDAVLSAAEYDTGAAINQSAYSALVNGKTVCAGYARAYQYLLQQLRIPCYYCTGYSGQNHAWNIVKLEDGYYNVDTTWDDTDPASYDYFNKSDREFAPTHVRKGLSVYLPACGGGAYGGLESEGPKPVQVKEAEALPQPMHWVDRDADEGGTVSAEDSSGDEAERLRQAGVRESEVLKELSDYFEDCLKQTQQVGAGDQQFTNVVPEALWPVIEQQYVTGSYEEGFAEEALEKLGRYSFIILVEAENLGGGYYKLYHYTSIY